jgi:hypothetical protein
MKNLGKIKSIPVKEITVGMQVTWKSIVRQCIGTVKSTTNTTTWIELDNMKDNIVAIENWCLNTIVVEYDYDVNHLMEVDYRQLPLKNSDWQHAIDDELLDSNKESKIVIVDKFGGTHDDLKPKVAKLIRGDFESKQTMNNYKLIILPEQNIIVSDEEYTNGDFIYTTNIPIEKVKDIDKNYSTEKGYEWLITVEDSKNQYKPIEIKGKIIAGITSLPSIDYNGFDEKLGIIDVEKLAFKVYPKTELKDKSDPHYDFSLNWMEMQNMYRSHWINGFKAANKYYSELNLRNAFKAGVLRGLEHRDRNDKYETPNVDSFINSLLLPKVIPVELEMYTTKAHLGKPPALLITNNSVKIIKLL